MITKKLDEGSPNVVDVIRSRQVMAVINTVTDNRGPMKDGFAIRRAAAEHGVPCFTSLDTLAAAVRVLAEGQKGYNVARVDEYLSRSLSEGVLP
jgi:carbamoyl-phosphate synthase large subunit